MLVLDAEMVRRPTDSLRSLHGPCTNCDLVGVFISTLIVMGCPQVDTLNLFLKTIVESVLLLLKFF